MTTHKSVEEQIIDLGVEVDTHRDGDAFIRTYTFNDAQLQALLAEREAEVRREICNALEGEKLVENPNKLIPSDVHTHNIGYNTAIARIQEIVRGNTT